MTPSSMPVGNGGNETDGRSCESSCRFGCDSEQQCAAAQPAGCEVPRLGWPVPPVGLSFTSFLPLHL